MPHEVSLTYTDEGGQQRRVRVRPPRFAIGRGEDNDLVIHDPNLSRQHALIEFLSGAPFISDRGSSNGTFVNGQPLTSAVALYDRDLINLGGSCDVAVGINLVAAEPANVGAPRPAAPPTAPATSEVAAPAPTPTTTAAGAAPAPAPSRLAPVIIGGVVAAGLLLALLVGALLWFNSGEAKRERPSYDASVDDAPPLPAEEDGASVATSDSDNGTANANLLSGGHGAAPASATALSESRGAPMADRQPARAVRRVMERISNDTAPYVSEAGVKDVAAKIEGYRGSAALAEKFRAMQRGCPEVAALARANNLKPALLLYAALAQSEASGGDPLSAARQMAPKLLTLRATFGTETANSSLLLVAAYPYPFNPNIGSQERTPHPLASKLMEFGGKRSTEDTTVARSVWFLREKGGITPEAYELVVRLLAVGVVAQNPRQHGVEADPLLC